MDPLPIFGLDQLKRKLDLVSHDSLVFVAVEDKLYAINMVSFDDNGDCILCCNEEHPDG